MGLTEQLARNVFRVNERMKHKECCLCSEDISTGNSHAIKAERAGLFYFKHKLLLDPHKSLLCHNCHNKPMEDLVISDETVSKITTLNARYDINGVFTRITSKLIQSHWFGELLKVAYEPNHNKSRRFGIDKVKDWELEKLANCTHGQSWPIVLMVTLMKSVTLY